MQQRPRRVGNALAAVLVIVSAAAAAAAPTGLVRAAQAASAATVAASAAPGAAATAVTAAAESPASGASVTTAAKGPGSQAASANASPSGASAPTSIQPKGFFDLLTGEWLFNVLTGTTAASGLAWVIGRIYAQTEAKLTQSRTFIQETTKRVVSLSETHYWGLANGAGTLAASLRAYLETVEAHLMLVYVEPGTRDPQAVKRMSKRIADLAEESSRRSFPGLVRLVERFHRFHVGSNTYLLPRHSADEDLRRLYNQFVEALPPPPFLTSIRQGVELHLSNEAKLRSDGPPFGMAGSFLELPGNLLELGLDEPRQAWQGWLRDALPHVQTACDALEAYSAVLSHQLALLHEVFFEDRSDTTKVGDQLKEDTWTGLLSPAIVRTIYAARHQPRALSALGGIHAPPARDRQPADVDGKGNGDLPGKGRPSGPSHSKDLAKGALDEVGYA